MIRFLFFETAMGRFGISEDPGSQPRTLAVGDFNGDGKLIWR
jgi:hypothetical protein